MEYAIYQNQCYRIVVKNERVSLISNLHREGFDNYVNRSGKVHDDLFVKEVSEDNLDFAYRTKYLVDYHGQTFEVLADIGKRLLGQGKIQLYTEDRETARRLGFEPYDNGSFHKGIHLNEVDRITEIKIPILRFKGMESTRTIIEKDQILDYIMNLVE